MILSYHNLGEEKRHRVKVTLTTEHSASSYGQPVIMLEDGSAIDLFSWTPLGYRVIRINKKEMAELARMGLV